MLDYLKRLKIGKLRCRRLLISHNFQVFEAGRALFSQSLERALQAVAACAPGQKKYFFAVLTTFFETNVEVTLKKYYV